LDSQCGWLVQRGSGSVHSHKRGSNLHPVVVDISDLVLCEPPRNGMTSYDEPSQTAREYPGAACCAGERMVLWLRDCALGAKLLWSLSSIPTSPDGGVSLPSEKRFLYRPPSTGIGSSSSSYVAGTAQLCPRH